MYGHNFAPKINGDGFSNNLIENPVSHSLCVGNAASDNLSEVNAASFGNQHVQISCNSWNMQQILPDLKHLKDLSTHSTVAANLPSPSGSNTNHHSSNVSAPLPPLFSVNGARNTTGLAPAEPKADLSRRAAPTVPHSSEVKHRDMNGAGSGAGNGECGGSRCGSRCGSCHCEDGVTADSPLSGPSSATPSTAPPRAYCSFGRRRAELPHPLWRGGERRPAWRCMQQESLNIQNCVRSNLNKVHDSCSKDVDKLSARFDKKMKLMEIRLMNRINLLQSHEKDEEIIESLRRLEEKVENTERLVALDMRSKMQDGLIRSNSNNQLDKARRTSICCDNTALDPGLPKTLSSEDRKRLKARLKEYEEQKAKQKLKNGTSDADADSEDGAGGDDRLVRETRKQKVLEYLFGICTEDKRTGRIASKFIHPTSRFMLGMVLLSFLFLLYTGVVVPVQVGLYEYHDACDVFPTFSFDVLVDTFFLLEILVNFFVGVYDEKGAYRDELRYIAEHYVSSVSKFWFDAITSIPISYIEIPLYMECNDGKDASPVTNARTIRALKVLRVIRLFRLLKFTKFFGVFVDYAIYYLGANIYKMARILIITLAVVHVSACAFWKVKTESANSPEEVVLFLEERHVAEHLVCLYYMFTIFTTIGHADMSIQSPGERVLCVILFLSGASLFGTLIGQMSEIIQSTTLASQQLERRLEAYLSIDPRLGISAMRQIFEWVKFQFAQESAYQLNKEALDKECLPGNLRLQVAKRIENCLFSKIHFLKGNDFIVDIQSMISAEFMLKSIERYYVQGCVIADSRETADGLMVITSGIVSVEVPMDSEAEDKENSVLQTLGRGDTFGDNVVVGDQRWAGTLGVRADFIAKTNCSIAFIKKEDVESILQKFEFFPILCKVELAKCNFKGQIPHWNSHDQEFIEEDTEAHSTSGGGESPQGLKLGPKEIFFWIQIARHALSTSRSESITRLITQNEDNLLCASEESTDFSMTPEEEVQIRELFNFISGQKSFHLLREQILAAARALQAEVAMIDAQAEALYQMHLSKAQGKLFLSGFFSALLHFRTLHSLSSGSSRRLNTDSAQSHFSHDEQSQMGAAAALFDLDPPSIRNKLDACNVLDKELESAAETIFSNYATTDPNLVVHISLADFKSFVRHVKTAHLIRPTLTADQEQQIRIAFQLFDENDDGEISRAEFWHALAELGFDLPRATASEDFKERARKLFRLYDIDGSGTISMDEFRAIVWHFGLTEQIRPTLTAQQKREIRACYELFDADRGGTLQIEELAGAMYALGFESTKLDQNFKENFGNNYGPAWEINADQFEDFMQSVALTSRGLLIQAKEAFDMIRCPDTRGHTKRISRAALAEYAARACIDLSERELDAMVGPKGIGFLQFYRVMKQTCWY